MRSGFQLHNIQRIRKLYMLSLGAFLINWYKKALPMLSFITDA